MSAYSDVYLSSISDTQGNVFFDVRDVFPEMDEKWFITAYMKGNIRRLLDHANPKYASAPSVELIKRFIEDECGGEYKRGESWGGFMPKWAGIIYALYQWQYSVPSTELIDHLTLDDIERIYPALHQMGWKAAVDKIHTVVLGNGDE